MLARLDLFALRILPALKYISLIVLPVAIIYGALLTLRYWYSMLNFPGVLIFGEGVILYEVHTLLAGLNLYPDTTAQTGSFIGSIYGPVYYLTLAAMMGGELGYFPLRLLSIIGSLMIVLGVGIVIYHYTRSILGAIAGGFLIIYSAHMNIGLIYFGAYGKPDAISIGFTIMGFALSLINLENRKVYLGIPFFVLGLYFKQTAIIAPAVIIIFLFFNNWRRALMYFLYCVVGSAIILGLIALMFDLGAVIEHMIAYNTKQEVNLYLGIVHHSYFFIAENLSGILLGILCYIYTRNHKIALFFALAYILFIPSMGKRGSGIQYWIQPDIGILMMVGLGFAKAITDKKEYRPLLQASILICALLYVGYHNPKYRKKLLSSEAYNLQIDFNKEISRLVGDKRPRVFSAQPGDFAPLGEKSDLVIVDPFLYNELIRSGKKDDALFLDFVRNQKFELVVLDYDASMDNLEDAGYLLERVSASQAREILKTYKLVGSKRKPRLMGGGFRDVYMYAPK